MTVVLHLTLKSQKILICINNMLSSSSFSTTTTAANTIHHYQTISNEACILQQQKTIKYDKCNTEDYLRCSSRSRLFNSKCHI